MWLTPVDQFHAVAIGGVWPVRNRLAVQMLFIPTHRLGRTGRGDVDVMVIGRTGHHWEREDRGCDRGKRQDGSKLVHHQGATSAFALIRGAWPRPQYRRVNSP